MADENVTQDPEPEPEPAGAVEVQGQKMVPLSALTAERERVRTKTEERLRAEHEPIKAKAAQADQLAADLVSVQPFVEHLRRHPELMREAPKPDEPQVADDEAEKFARDYELYTPTGLDLGRAKRIIARNRQETTQVARQAAAEAVQPYAQSSAQAQAKQNFIWAASQTGPDGSPLVDPNDLAQMWATFPPELTANPEVARVVLDAAIGVATRTGKRTRPAGHDPVFTESPGGRPPGGYRISAMEQKMARSIGVDDKKWAESAQTYRPDAENILGD